MRERFRREEMFSFKIDPERWLVLITKGLHNWNLRVVGPEPLNVDLVDLTDQEAQGQALSLATKHFEAVNPKVVISRIQQWRLALSSEQACSATRIRRDPSFPLMLNF
jgi:hypothetical protein